VSATADGPAPCWRLSVGIHNGTLMSRDSGSHPYPTEQAALDAWRDQERSIARFGYQVWFASLTSPEGESTTLHAGVPYY
jgi:hypothetical protein